MKGKHLRSPGIILLILFCFLAMVGQLSAKSNVAELKKKLAVLVDQNKDASAKTKQFIKFKLIPQIGNPTFAKAIKAQNAQHIPMAEIKKIDDEWQAAEDFLKIHDQMMSGVCADEVRSLVGQLGALGETFVMDNQGANVCQNELTGDYWQGDEAKWKNSFNNGAGGLDIGVEKLDRSSNMVLQQVSLPITDTDGMVIGAITYGVMTGKL